MATGTRRANTLSSPQLLWLYGRSRRRAPGGWRRRSAGAGGTFSPLPPRPCSPAARGRTARARGTLRCTSAYARTWRGCLYSLRTPRSGSATGCSARTYSQTLRRRWNKQPDIDPWWRTQRTRPPAGFPCPDAPLSPPQSPVVLVAPGAPLRPARKRRIDDDLMKWIVEELGIYHLNVLRLRAENARLRARLAALGQPDSESDKDEE